MAHLVQALQLRSGVNIVASFLVYLFLLTQQVLSDGPLYNMLLTICINHLSQLEHLIKSTTYGFLFFLYTSLEFLLQHLLFANLFQALWVQGKHRHLLIRNLQVPISQHTQKYKPSYYTRILYERFLLFYFRIQLCSLASWSCLQMFSWPRNKKCQQAHLHHAHLLCSSNLRRLWCLCRKWYRLCFYKIWQSMQIYEASVGLSSRKSLDDIAFYEQG